MSNLLIKIHQFRVKDKIDYKLFRERKCSNILVHRAAIKHYFTAIIQCSVSFKVHNYSSILNNLKLILLRVN